MTTWMRTGTTIALAWALGLAPAQAADLIEVYRMALESDPQFAAAQATNRAAQENKPQARAALLPQIGADAGTNYNNQKAKRARATGTLHGDAGFNTHSWGINLVQPVFHWDRWIQLGQANSQVSRANAELDAAAQDLIVRTSQAYFDVLGAQDTLEFATTTKEAFSQQLNQAEQRFEVGLIAITDVEEAKAGRDLAVAEEIRARNQLENAHEALRALVGEYLRELAPLAGEVPLLPPEPNNIEQWTDTALAQNRALAAATFTSKIAEDEIRRRNSGHLPTLDLVAGRDYSASSDSVTLTGVSVGGSSRTYTDSVGLQLTLPIYQGGLVTSQTQQARHNFQAALEQLEQSRRSAHRQTRQSFNGIVDSISAVIALRQALSSTQKALEAVEAGFQVGTRTTVDVLNAQRNTYESRRDYKSAQYGYILSTLRLKQAAGVLSPDDLVPVNQWLKH